MSYFRHGDPLDDFDRLDREQARRYERLPVCDNRRCRRKIDDEFFYEVDGEYLCEECMKDRYQRSVEEFIEL